MLQYYVPYIVFENETFLGDFHTLWLIVSHFFVCQVQKKNCKWHLFAIVANIAKSDEGGTSYATGQFPF